MFGFRLLFGFGTGILLAFNCCQLKLGEFDPRLFSDFLLPPVALAAGMLVDVHRLIANLKTILIRGIFTTLASFVLVSIGAAFCLPKLGIQSLTASDCLVIGSLFASTNFFFIFQGMDDGRENIRSLYEIAIGESVLNSATSFLLFKLVRNMDLSSLQPGAFLYLVAKFSYSLVASIHLGILIGVFIVAMIGFISKLIDPETACVCSDGGLRMKDRSAPEVMHCLLFLISFLFHIHVEGVAFSGILVIFSYGIMTSHCLLPETTGYKVTWRYESPVIGSGLETLLYLRAGNSIAKSKHWGYVFSSRETFGTYLAVTCSMFILLMVGRAPCVFHFSRNVMTKEERTTEGTEKAYLFNKWAIDNIELENKVAIWWSGFMPSLISIGLAMDQFGKSEETRHAYMLTGIVSVVCFSSLVYFIWMGTSLKQILVRLMMKLPSKESSSNNKAE